MYSEQVTTAPPGGVNWYLNRRTEVHGCAEITVETNYPSSTLDLEVNVEGEMVLPWMDAANDQGEVWQNVHSKYALKYRLKPEEVRVEVVPSYVDCGTIVGVETRACGTTFKVQRVGGGTLPRGKLAFSVPPEALTERPTIAKMGDAGTISVRDNFGKYVRLDGLPWDGNADAAFRPSVTGSGHGMGTERIGITATYTLD
ncbi:hypothetical protein [Aeromonas veronii]|uniref:hypothetical protein n=1 Tax=Aeromonas veronii TaxID=654 RepID=UPI0011C495F5|nr:hypothetical protein [Aeromonas veronii]